MPAFRHEDRPALVRAAKPEGVEVMTDKERDDLLLSIAATQCNQGATLERIEHDHGGKLESIRSTLHEHDKRLRNQGATLERIEHNHGKLLMEQRTKRLAAEKTLEDHGTRLSDLEAQAG